MGFDEVGLVFANKKSFPNCIRWKENLLKVQSKVCRENSLL